jgi:hypothetical protein
MSVRVADEEVVRLARELVEFAEGRSSRPPVIPKERLKDVVLALRRLGYDPAGVVERVRARAGQLAQQRQPEEGGGGLRSSVRVRVGGGTTVYVLLPGSDGWALLRDVVRKKVSWVSPSEGFLDIEAGDLPVGSVVREVTWGKRGPVARFFSVQPGGLREEEVAYEEDEPAGSHLGHELRARVAVMESGLRVPLYWFVAGGPLKSSVRAQDSLAKLKRELEEAVEQWQRREGAQGVPDDVKRAVLGALPSWADGAYVERVEYFVGGDVHRAIPAPPDVREKVIRALAGWIRGKSPPSGSPWLPVAPTGRLGELLLVPEPPQQLARLVWPTAPLTTSGGRVAYYARLQPGSVPEGLARELDREVPSWRKGELLVPVVPFGNTDLSDPLNRFYRVARALPGLPRRAGEAEVVARGAEELAKWEYAVVTRGDPVSVVKVAPLKRSSRGEGYYYKVGWSKQLVVLDIPPPQAEKLLRGLVVLRDGTAYRAEGVPGAGGYVNIPPPLGQQEERGRGGAGEAQAP